MHKKKTGVHAIFAHCVSRSLKKLACHHTGYYCTVQYQYSGTYLTGCSALLCCCDQPGAGPILQQKVQEELYYLARRGEDEREQELPINTCRNILVVHVFVNKIARIF